MQTISFVIPKRKCRKRLYHNYAGYCRRHAPLAIMDRQYAMQGKLITTAPIEYSASRVKNNTVLQGPHKENNAVLVSGFLICRADSVNELEEWSKTCPILKYPMSSVEIRPLIPFPIN